MPENVIEIENGEDIFNIKDNKDVSEGFIDFSKIPYLHDEILFLLNENPSFYKKNFKNVLDKFYKNLPKYIKKNVDSYTRANKTHSYNTFIHTPKSRKKFSGDDEDYIQWLDEIFLERWKMPNNWSQFKIHINKDYNLTYIKTSNNLFMSSSISLEYLFNFFTEISESQITKFNYDIQFMNLIYQFSLELVKKNAFVPQLFKSNNQYVIRWIPALFDENILEIVDRLALDCPDNLVKFKNRLVSKKSQVIACVSLFIQGLIDIYLSDNPPKLLQKDFDEDIFKLFFFDGIKSKNSTSNAKLVQQWISKFDLNNDFQDLYIVVEEEDELFELSLCVGDDLENIHDVVNNTSDNNYKFELLKQSHLITDIFPDFETALKDGTNIVLDINEFSEFFLKILPLFKIMGLKIILPKSLKNQFKPYIRLNIYSNNTTSQSFMSLKDITDFDWKVQIGDEDLDIEEFKELAKDSKGFVKFNNDYVMLDKKEVESLINKMDKLPEKLSENEIMQSMLAGEFMEAQVNMDNKLSDLLKSITHYEDIKVPKEVNADLRQYQEVGFSWLAQNIDLGFGSILADDMGLGKTLEVLTLIQYLKNQKAFDNDKILIIAPTGLITNWKKEIEKFTPDLSSFIYYGIDRQFPEDEYDIYLTSYGIIRQDVDEFKKKKWFLVVVDEAQNIKNPQAKQTRAVKSVKSKHRIAMSGTPIENRLSDYWSIFDFINRGYLINLKKFKRDFIVPIEKEQNVRILDNFKKITSPFILRRVKSDKNIIKDLPDKIVNNIYCNLSKKQVSLYKETLDDVMEEIANNDGIQRKGMVLKLISSLKQICNHPAQFTKSSIYKIDDSGKLETLVDTVGNILESNEKMLIFTQYRQMGEIIKDTLQNTFNTEALFLHGAIKRNQRDEMIEEFQTNSQIKIFIITLKTGGTGLNLTAATNVIHYDLWWNPAVENQATDRVHRIGQDKDVMVYRFITKGTLEEKINDIIIQKEDLANQAIKSGETFITEMDNDELKELMMLR